MPGATEETSGLGRALSTAIISFHQAVADHLGLSAADHKALEIVSRDGPLTAGELARRTRLTRSATTTLIDRLVAAGMVERRVDASDRRRAIITATVTEHPAIAPAYAALASAMAATMAQFTHREQLVILRYVSETVAVLHDQTDRLRARTE